METGTIRQLIRYPVKSMRGEALDSEKLTFQGLAEDRRFAFVQAASPSAFPWLTARQLTELLRYEARVANAGTEQVSVTITVPGGESWPVQSEELRSRLEEGFGGRLFLLRDYRGSYDVAPVSLISLPTVARIAEESGTADNVARFRPNLVVDLASGHPFEELSWVGRILLLGDTARIALTEADQRCVMITLDPEGGPSKPEVLKWVVQQHDKCAGVYGCVLTPGQVSVGDAVRLE